MLNQENEVHESTHEEPMEDAAEDVKDTQEAPEILDAPEILEAQGHDDVVVEEAEEVEDASIEADEEDESLFLSPDDSEGEEVDFLEEEAPVSREEFESAVARAEEAEARATTLSEEITELIKERDDAKSRMLRAIADRDNFRKRADREKGEVRKYGSDRLVLELLPAVDNLERALEHAQSTNEESSISEGVRMVHRQLLTSLEKHGVKGYASLGEMFDPTRHEAIQQLETSDSPTNTILQEFQKGYFLHDRLLRPALVVVARYVEPESEAELEEIETGEVPEADDAATFAEELPLGASADEEDAPAEDAETSE